MKKFDLSSYLEREVYLGAGGVQKILATLYFPRDKRYIFD